ncbi:MAG: nucleotidyltransferase family protein [Sporolactobacillus sp.]
MNIPLKDFLVQEAATLIETLACINTNASGTAVVVDSDKHLKGTITDGDIRRAILKGRDLYSSIEQIYNAQCQFVHEQFSPEEAEDLFSQAIKLVPVVDQNRQVIDCLRYQNYIVSAIERSNPVVIMAGGLGTRLRPLTENTPKPMLHIGEKPILERIIERVKKAGFHNIFLSVNYKSEVIENYFMDGSAFGVTIQYIREEQRLGTAGPIAMAAEYLHEPFIVVNGDIFTNLDFGQLMDFHLHGHYSMTVGSRDYKMQVPYGVLNVNEQNHISSLDEKPIFHFAVSGGVYVLSPEAIHFIPENQFYDIPQLINKLLENGNTVGNYPILDYWMDIGRMEDYQEVNRLMKNKMENVHNV